MKYMAGHLGNGLTIWDKTKEERGDYKKVAHINSKRELTIYVKKPDLELREFIESLLSKNHTISATQADQFVFEK